MYFSRWSRTLGTESFLQKIYNNFSSAFPLCWANTFEKHLKSTYILRVLSTEHMTQTNNNRKTQSGKETVVPDRIRNLLNELLAVEAVCERGMWGAMWGLCSLYYLPMIYSDSCSIYIGLRQILKYVRFIFSLILPIPSSLYCFFPPLFKNHNSTVVFALLRDTQIVILDPE